MSDSKGNGPSLIEIFGQLLHTASEAAAPVANHFVTSTMVAVESALDSFDGEALSQEVDAAKDQLLGASSTALFTLAGKAASHPLGRKAVGAIFAPKQSGGGKHEASEATNSLGDTIINTAVDGIGRFITTKFNFKF